MNTVGCPEEGLFTDEILIPSDLTVACQGRVAVWLGLAVPLLVVRWLLLIPQVVDTRRRQKKKEQLASTARGRFTGTSTALVGCSRRIPFFLLSQIGGTFISTLFVILASTHSISTRDGSSMVVFGLFIASVAMGHGIMARTIIKLGKKIIPLSEKRLQAGQQNGEEMKDLSKIDLPLKVLGLLGGLASLIAVVLLLISPAVDVYSRRVLFQASFFAIASYQLLAGASIVYQFKRCLQAIAKLTFNNGSSGTTEERAVSPESPQTETAPSHSSHIIRRDEQSRSATALHNAILAMRVQMTITTLTASSMMVVSLLIASLVLPLYYWLYCIIYIFVDVFFQSSLLFAPMLSKMRGKQGSKGSKSSESKPQGNTGTGGEVAPLTTMAEPDTRTVTHVSSRFNTPSSVVGSSFAV